MYAIYVANKKSPKLVISITKSSAKKYRHETIEVASEEQATQYVEGFNILHGHCNTLIAWNF